MTVSKSDKLNQISLEKNFIQENYCTAEINAIDISKIREVPCVTCDIYIFPLPQKCFMQFKNSITHDTSSMNHDAKLVKQPFLIKKIHNEYSIST